jgi:hypothetical protein
MDRLNPAKIGLDQLVEHLQPEVGDEAVAEIGHGDIGHIFGDCLDRGDDDDRRGDPVDHVRLLGDEHVVRGALNEEGDGARGRGREQHGHRGHGQKKDVGA